MSIEVAFEGKNIVGAGAEVLSVSILMIGLLVLPPNCTEY